LFPGALGLATPEERVYKVIEEGKFRKIWELEKK
jgi:hypothetical protein